jgi:hypothetical protein
MTLLGHQKLHYFRWALIHKLTRRNDTTCPACGYSVGDPIARKYWVTALCECRVCGLRFRIPKDEAFESANFYQTDYSSGFTTTLPSEDQLSMLLQTQFKGTDKDFTHYIQVLQAAGVPEGGSVLDYGCSWGYGSWQLRQAGFKVYSYEISRPRREYAAQRLGCAVLPDLDNAPREIDCLFSAHVIEHLSDPNVLWAWAQKVLSSNGLMICFCPNGDPSLEAILGPRQYHRRWGKVHPLLVTPKFCHAASARHGFSSHVYTTPYQLTSMAAWRQSTDFEGEELCFIARRTQTSARVDRQQ